MNILNPLVRALALILVFSGLSIAAGYPGRIYEKFSLRAVRTLYSAQMTYASTYGNGNFGTINTLGQAQLIDPALATGRKYGYVFTVSVTIATATLPADFTVTATPQLYGKTGRISFLIRSIGDIRGGDIGGAIATMNDPIIADWSTGSIADNEFSTSMTMQYLRSAQSYFFLATGNGQYGSMSQLVVTGRIDPRLGTGLLRGYVYNVLTTPATGKSDASYSINATPQSYGVSGIRSFFVDQTCVIRAADRQGGPADQNDPPITFWH